MTDVEALTHTDDYITDFSTVSAVFIGVLTRPALDIHHLTRPVALFFENAEVELLRRSD